MMYAVNSFGDVEAPSLAPEVCYPIRLIPDHILPISFREINGSLAIIKSFEAQKMGFNYSAYRRVMLKKIALVFVSIVWGIAKMHSEIYDIYLQRKESKNFQLVVGLIIIVFSTVISYRMANYWEKYEDFKQMYSENTKILPKLNDIKNTIERCPLVRDAEGELDFIAEKYAVYVGAGATKGEVKFIKPEDEPEFSRLAGLFAKYTQLTNKYVENHKKLIKAKLV